MCRCYTYQNPLNSQWISVLPKYLIKMQKGVSSLSARRNLYPSFEEKELGGYMPSLDHRIAPDSQWELTQYYVDRFHRIFG